MSLEQKLEDPVFLEKTVVNTIEYTVTYLKAYCKSKEEFGMNDEHYNNAKDFLKKYNNCKLYGVTTDFKNDLLPNMLFSTTGRIFRKSLPYFIFGTVGLGLAYWAYEAGNLPLAISGAVAGFGAVVTAFLLPKCEYHDTMLIYRAMQKHPEVIDKALRTLYQKEKNV
jgi:hypothetical protein